MSVDQLRRIAVLERKLDIYQHSNVTCSIPTHVIKEPLTVAVAAIDLTIDNDDDANMNMIENAFRWKPNETSSELKNRHRAIAFISSVR